MKTKKIPLYFSVFFICTLLLFPSSIYATDWYADGTKGIGADNCANCTDPNNPCRDVQYIVNNCAPGGGDTFYACNIQSWPFVVNNSLAGAPGSPTTFRHWTTSTDATCNITKPAIDAGGNNYGVELNNADWVVFDSWVFTKANLANLYIHDGSTNVILSTLESHEAGSGWPNGQGILVDNSNAVTITDLRATDNLAEGVLFRNSANGGIVSRGKLDGNLINLSFNNADGYLIANNYLSNPDQTNIVINNGADNGQIFYNSTYGGYGAMINNSTGAQVTDNSFYVGINSWESGVYLVTAVATSGTTLDYNNYYSPSSGHLGTIELAGPETNYDTIADWRTALGGCPNVGNECASINSDPAYINAAGGDLSINAGSPLINIALNVGIATDIKETPRPQGAGYDIGANEREEEGPGVPEFTLTTLLLALFAGLGVIILLNKLQKTHKAI
ncbi:hypothetical protein KKC88_04245 [Patescibacteria group bacterium]|nr:hypothetical protein [Patescibacteria group bacterium]MBU1674025.1 hypothetical protein [Patescibacteria group bacterium]MBU1963833.1 hypothetical protein [Patescibacteria group bacterium]